MSVEIRVRLPKKLYDIIEDKAKKRGLTVNDLIVYTISRVIEE